MLRDDYYKILESKPTDSRETIHANYLRQLKNWHPDRNLSSLYSEKMSVLITTAWDTLKDPEKRLAYDKKMFGKSVVPDNIYHKMAQDYHKRVKQTIDESRSKIKTTENRN